MKFVIKTADKTNIDKYFFIDICLLLCMKNIYLLCALEINNNFWFSVQNLWNGTEFRITLKINNNTESQFALKVLFCLVTKLLSQTLIACSNASS